MLTVTSAPPTATFPLLPTTQIQAVRTVRGDVGAIPTTRQGASEAEVATGGTGATINLSQDLDSRLTQPVPPTAQGEMVMGFRVK